MSNVDSGSRCVVEWCGKRKTRPGNHQMTARTIQGDPRALIHRRALHLPAKMTAERHWRGGRSWLTALRTFTHAGSARQNPSSPDSTRLRYIGGGRYGSRYNTHAPRHRRSTMGFTQTQWATGIRRGFNADITGCIFHQPGPARAKLPGRRRTERVLKA